MNQILQNLSMLLGINIGLLSLGAFIIYFAPTFLATSYGVSSFWFILINLFFGRSPIPRTILIIKAIKNKNLYRDEEKRNLNCKFSKKELEEFEKMKKERDKRLQRQNELTSIKSPVQINN